MMTHLVLLSPRADLSPAERSALIAAFRRAVAEIPTVRGFHVGARVLHGAGYETPAQDGAGYLVAIEFDDLAGLQAYLRHPAHEELGRQFARSVTTAAVYDFESSDLDWLAGRPADEGRAR
jgi:heme-degrading monooxygenase HmoA